MSFLAPLAGILAAAALPVVVLLYFLRLKRQPHTVPSTLLWRRSFRDMRANTPFQRLRKNLLMFLQCAVFALLAFALARPLVQAPSLAGHSRVLLLDVSASMAVREKGGTRFELACAQVTHLLDEMGRGDEAMLLAFGNSAEVLASFTGVVPVLRDALRNARVRETATDIREALLIAIPALRERANPEVVIFSDGALGPLPTLGADDDVPVRLVVVGEAETNVGLTGCEVRTPPDPAAGPELFVRVQNFGLDPVTAVCECRLAGLLLNAQEVRVAAGGEAPVVFGLPPEASGLAEVRLAASDAFATDDRVQSVIAPLRRLRVALVAKENWFLERLLPSMGRVEAVRVDPADFAARGPSAAADAEGRPPEVVILDADAAAALTDPPPGAYLMLARAGWREVTDEGEIAAPTILDWNRTHPVTRFCAFSRLNIERARRWKLPEDALTLLEAEEGPLIATLARGGVRAVLVAFDPMDSDWWTRVSFPLFFANAVEWLAGGSAPPRGRHQRTGEPLLLVPHEGRALAVVDPAGTRHDVDLSGTTVPAYRDTHAVGVYRVEGERETREVALNLADPAESRIAPVAELALPGARTDQVQITRSIATGRRELWRAAVIAAFLLLLVEWYIYSRRAV